MSIETGYDLIVTIVPKGKAEVVVEAARKAGAEGGTILFGRGTGIHETQRLFNIPIEPEKEIVLTLIPKTLTERVAQAIREATDLEKPGKGIAFVIDVAQVMGIAHRQGR